MFSKLFFIKYEPMLRCIINCREKIFKKKFLPYFLPKQFCTHLWFIKKLERREKFEIFGIQENMIATNLKKLINDNTIIKSGGCKIRLYILTNIGALFSEFLQTILINAYFLGKDTSAYSRGINKFIDLI